MHQEDRACVWLAPPSTILPSTHFPKLEESKVVLSHRKSSEHPSLKVRTGSDQLWSPVSLSRGGGGGVLLASRTGRVGTRPCQVDPKRALLPGSTTGWLPTSKCLQATCLLTLQTTQMIPKPGAPWSCRGWPASSSTKARTGESAPLRQPPRPAASSVS